MQNAKNGIVRRIEKEDRNGTVSAVEPLMPYHEKVFPKYQITLFHLQSVLNTKWSSSEGEANRTRTSLFCLLACPSFWRCIIKTFVNMKQSSFDKNNLRLISSMPTIFFWEYQKCSNTSESRSRLNSFWYLLLRFLVMNVIFKSEPISKNRILIWRRKRHYSMGQGKFQLDKFQNFLFRVELITIFEDILTWNIIITAFLSQLY